VALQHDSQKDGHDESMKKLKDPNIHGRFQAKVAGTANGMWGLIIFILCNPFYSL
jgi:hypothetical protein